MQCQSRQCNSDLFPHLFFYQSDLTTTDPQSCRRMSQRGHHSMRHGSSRWRHAIKSCLTQRSAVLRGGTRTEFNMHTQASAVLRGGAEHISSRQSPTQTEGGCWSQNTPGYQAEPITTSRYTIPLDSPIWRVRYIYRT